MSCDLLQLLLQTFYSVRKSPGQAYDHSARLPARVTRNGLLCFMQPELGNEGCCLRGWAGADCTGMRGAGKNQGQAA